jgi:NAD(P)-dependent dehydrogenase (short-subunit alcohol dehydrogenase family)
MTSTTAAASTPLRPELAGQTVVAISGSAGIGLETARQARAEGAEVILTARRPDRLNPAAKVRPGGTLLFMGGTGGRHTAPGLAFISALTAALPALTKNLALELAPIRVNLIAAGFVDTPLSAALLGDRLDARREQLRATLPIRRVIGPADIAALAVHLMTNGAATGATLDIDGGQQLVPS